MTGFNDEALDFMLNSLKENFPERNADAAKAVFNLAMTYDLDYMASAGIIKDGAFTDEYYDEDDAFDFIAEHISNAIPDIDTDDLSDFIELYFEYHDAFMEEKGLLSWE